MTNQNQHQVPVTVLTGFLGSGKTTLLNRILTAQHGKRIAVIENEFGEVGIDQDLVIRSEEEIFEMNNGCICCTVRGDLIRILGNLMKRRDKFDYILIETTGLADPSPVASTFFFDQEIQSKLRLDGIVTLVDCKHVWQHFEDSEVQQQIAFADVILLNKIDLVPPEEIDKLEAKIKSMNSTCQIHRTQNSEIDLNRILEVRGFSLDRVLDIDPTFLDGELPFEWGGIYHLKPGEHQLMLRSGPNPSLDLMLFPVGGTDAAMLESAAKFAAQHFADPPGIVEVGDSFSPGNEPQALLLSKAENRFTMQIEREAFYALFTQHQPAEFQLTLQREGTVLDAAIHREFGSHHEHNEAVKSVGITLSGDLNPNKLNAWFQKLMAERGPDIYRMKGVLSIAGDEQRFVFQGVHMLLDARPDRPWGRDPRSNKLIFIGKNLNREELTEGFRKCLV